MSLSPKFAVYEKVREIECQSEIEKGLTKIRWENTRDTNQQKTTTPTTTTADKFKEYNENETKIDFRNMRPSDLEKNRRVILPPAIKVEIEI